MPEIDDQTSYETDITKVEIRGNNTIVYFSYQITQASGNNYQFQFPYQNQPRRNSGYTISFNPKSYINGNGKRFKYVKCTGIPELPEEKEVVPGEKYRFIVYFEKLDPGIETFNLIEGKNRPEDSHKYWNFYGVHINNPLVQVPPTDTKKSAPREDEEVMLTIKGKLIDSKTNKPIVGKVLYRYDFDAQKSDSVKTTPTGEFTFKIKPEAYTFIASAKGYENTQESMDLSKLDKSQLFNQSFYLNPIEKEIKKPETVKETPKVVESKKEENKPIMIEENKFRLDKVYFEIGESKLLPNSYEQLNGLLKMLKDDPKMNIIVEGHTDNVGEASQNKRLSLERAYNVREYLISKGIPGYRIQFKGYGDTKPIADNNTEEGRKQNRRVEFLIIE
ncbi:OmpA/MotB domain protein [Emticicia oligotrophica DSM 17448]|uniref:OmpA/MotB domain protein n=2 Tax=Leadbetterellaceae TaxID=3141702 RepID=A0ABM5N5W3_EMTOG|nr:OmpA/MotB domain protein [Emticicia oligotrophica DSM 17448]